MSFTEKSLDFIVAGFVVRIKVESDCAFIEYWVLRDYCDLISQIGKSDGSDVDSIDADFTFTGFDYSGESEANCSFASAGSTDDSDFFTAFDVNVETFEN